MTRISSICKGVSPLLVALLLSGAAGCGDKPAVTPVSGQVLSPLAGARVYVYGQGENLFGPAQVVSEPTGADGSFSLNLPPGNYLVVVRKRLSGDPSGPVNAGDLRGDPVPLVVEAGRPVTLPLTALLKDANDKAFPAAAEQGRTLVSGTIRDEQGNPVKDVRVHLYDHIQMSERPKYVSERTGPDGRYSVPVARGGTYYVAARDRFGGPPQVGDLYGRYDEGTVDPSGVVVRQGEATTGVDITVHKVW